MQLNSTFQLMDVIAGLVAGPRPKVTGNQTKIARDRLKNLFEMAPLKNKFVKTEGDPINLNQIEIDNSRYPIKVLSIFTGFEPKLKNKPLSTDVDYSNRNHDEETVVFIHPYGQPGLLQGIILSNAVLRAHFDATNLLNFDTIKKTHKDEYLSMRTKADYLLEMVAYSFKSFFYYLFEQTHELGVFQDSRSMYRFPYAANNRLYCYKDLHFVNNYVLDAMVNTIMRKIYERICNDNSRLVSADKEIAFKKIFDNIFLNNLADYQASVIAEQSNIYKRYSEITNGLIDVFMLSDPSLPIDAWLNNIAVVFDKVKEN